MSPCVFLQWQRGATSGILEAHPLYYLYYGKGDKEYPQGTFNAAVVASLKRHYPERFVTKGPRVPGMLLKKAGNAHRTPRLAGLCGDE